MHCYVSRLLLAMLLAFAAATHAADPSGVLNDTGLIQCFDGTVMSTCSVSNVGDASARPGQDGRFGRDVVSPAKVGAGSAGFDFTKVCMNGSLNCTGAADITASPDSPTAWACTQDNVTHLIWSLNSHAGNWTEVASRAWPEAHNAQSRCGFRSGWRLPTRRELLSIAHFDGRRPAIDGDYFPGTPASGYWTSDSYQPNAFRAWMVGFNDGSADADNKATALYVRLVHDGSW